MVVLMWGGGGTKLHEFLNSILTFYILISKAKVADEESRQWRAYNYIFSVLHGRGFPMAELCHPAWGDYKRSVAKSKLMGCLLKATATTNWGHGPWLAGKRFVDLETAASRFVSLASDDYMSLITERVSFDCGWMQGGPVLSRDDFKKSRAVRLRLPFASLF